jgi:hypothetical protein
MIGPAIMLISSTENIVTENRPLLAFVSLAARSTLMCIVTFVLAFAYMVGLTVAIGRKPSGKKK